MKSDEAIQKDLAFDCNLDRHVARRATRDDELI